MDRIDLADLIYLAAITLEYVALTWTPKQNFHPNLSSTYMPCFNFEASTFSQQHPYHYNDLDRRPERKNYPPPPMSKTRKSNRFICYNCRHYYEYDSDDEESEETEEETDINFFNQETFYQQPLGRMQLQSYRCRTNEESPTTKLKLLRVGGLKESSLSSCRPACSYRIRPPDKNSTWHGYFVGTRNLC
ncbi:hypothetical protein F8M41_026324 [Gigaspora margarita]|uniref:Uncharacterized protein n=1 Tax=Gigaspora margarita TaxID=4874 RepID=A0A8H3XHT3_GIGMA|nr:hypothetical protein F8M41_026324 [Gigaspora margarita]